MTYADFLTWSVLYTGLFPNLLQADLQQSDASTGCFFFSNRRVLVEVGFLFRFPPEFVNISAFIRYIMSIKGYAHTNFNNQELCIRTVHEKSPILSHLSSFSPWSVLSHFWKCSIFIQNRLLSAS